MSEIDKIPLKHFRNLFLHEKECNCEKEIDLILEPLEQLKPLEDLYRLENPREDGKFYIPDATTFYKWIVKRFPPKPSEELLHTVTYFVKKTHPLYPLREIYRRELNTDEVPEDETFYKWITNKILQNENIKREN